MKVVLLPGLDGTGILFKPFIEALPKHIDTLVISYPKTERQNYGELVSFVLAQLPEEDYILVGESFSGNIAYQIALSNPKHLKSIIFVASFLSNPRPLLLTMLNLLPAKILFAVPPPKLMIKAFMLGASAKKNIIQLFLEALKQVSPDVLSFRLKEIKKLQFCSQSCEVKATYIQATNDYLVPQRSVTTFENLFSDLRVVKVTGSHFILQSNPVECAKVVEKQFHEQTMNIVFDRVNVVKTSLVELCSCLERMENNELLFQYAVISLHNALQGAMTLTLGSPDITNTWKAAHAKKWIEVELPKQLATEGLYQPDKFPQLDFFMELYDKYFSSHPDIINRERINDLNSHRNDFIHFNTDILSLEKQYIINSCNEGVKAIIYILENENEIFGADQQSIYDLLIEAQDYLNK